MARPLLVSRLLERAATWFGRRELLALDADGPVRTTWARVAERAHAAADALRAMGVGPGDRVATLAWNTHRHLELYFAVPAMGAVLHTVNLRLSGSQVAEIVGHGGATVLLADPDQAAEVDRSVLGAAGVDRFVCLCDAGAAPEGWTSWEVCLAAAAADPGRTELAGAPDRRAPGSAPPAAMAALWPDFDEDLPAGLCYTSGTTGEPKGVLYSHRALVLHTMAISLPDAFGLSEADVVLPAVPMFHANAWGLPLAAAMTGAGLVLPGPRPDARRLADLMSDEGVTFAAAVPTVWLEALRELRARPRRLHPKLRIHAGGAPSPPSMIEAYRRELGIEIITGWGMTELTPVGMVTRPRVAMAGWTDDDLLGVRTSQGTPLPLMEAQLVDDDGRPAPADGATPGELEVRGPWVTAGYYRRSAPESFRGGWLRTGDVATGDEHGYFRLVDRTKDLIRSGGEWISSVRLEHALMGSAGVFEAAVVAVPDPKWQERPWAFVVPAPGHDLPEPEHLVAPLAELFPRWWLPDRVLYVDELPRTATGKVDKRALRERARALGEGDPATAGRTRAQ